MSYGERECQRVREKKSWREKAEEIERDTGLERERERGASEKERDRGRMLRK